MRALLSQDGDIAVEGAQADPQFAGEHMPGHRVTVPAQNLQQVEQALATGQGADSQLLQAVAGVVVEGTKTSRRSPFFGADHQLVCCSSNSPQRA